MDGFGSQVKSALTQSETFVSGAVPHGTLGGALLTRDQAAALYNRILLARGGAYGVHKPKYVGEARVPAQRRHHRA